MALRTSVNSIIVVWDIAVCVPFSKQIIHKFPQFPRSANALLKNKFFSMDIKTETLFFVDAFIHMSNMHCVPSTCCALLWNLGFWNKVLVAWIKKYGHEFSPFLHTSPLKMCLWCLNVVWLVTCLDQQEVLTWCKFLRLRHKGPCHICFIFSWHFFSLPCQEEAGVKNHLESEVLPSLLSQIP